MTTLLSQGGFGCVYYPGIQCSGEVDNDKKVVTKLQRKDFNANNEIVVGLLISSIKHYENYFIPVIKSCDIDLRRLDSKTIGDCQVVKTSNNLDYLLMTLDYVKNISLEESIVTSNSKEVKRRSFSKLMSMYKYLMSALDLLLLKNIIHFDLKVENLLFGIKTGTPLIIDFGISIPKDNLNKDNFKRFFYAYVPEYYIWPLEVHVINYLVHKTPGNLSDADITTISTDFCKTNAGLQFFSENLRRKYLLSCIYQLKKYIGKDRASVIETLLSYYYTWDSYSLGIMFITLFGKIFKEGFHFNKMLIYFTQLLLINISPDPTLRYLPQDSIDEYNNSLYIEDNVDNYIHLLSDLR